MNENSIIQDFYPINNNFNKNKFFSFILLLSIAASTISAQNSKDVNGDGLINITDITTLIDFVLNPSTADSVISVNGDSIMDVNDVTFLIDFFLNAPASGTMCVLRGGTWSSSNKQHRVASRDRWYPDEHDWTMGFRLCLSE